MKSFRIVRKTISYDSIEINADSQEQAQAIAQDATENQWHNLKSDVEYETGPVDSEQPWDHDHESA